MGLLIMIVIFLALWKILGTLGHIFLPILAVLFILATWIPSQAIVMVIWVPIAILYFIGLAGYKHAKQNQYKYILIEVKAMELYVGTYSTHVFDFTIAIGIICFIALVVILVYWNPKRKQHPAHYQPSGQHASVVQRQNMSTPKQSPPALNNYYAGSTPAARIKIKKEGILCIKIFQGTN